MVHLGIQLVIAIKMHKKVHLRLHVMTHFDLDQWLHLLMQSLMKKFVQNGSDNGGPDAALEESNMSLTSFIILTNLPLNLLTILFYVAICLLSSKDLPPNQYLKNH